jgi:hypothetical protein
VDLLVYWRNLGSVVTEFAFPGLARLHKDLNPLSAVRSHRPEVSNLGVAGGRSAMERGSRRFSKHGQALSWRIASATSLSSWARTNRPTAFAENPMFRFNQRVNRHLQARRLQMEDNSTVSPTLPGFARSHLIGGPRARPSEDDTR